VNHSVYIMIVPIMAIIRDPYVRRLRLHYTFIQKIIVAMYYLLINLKREGGANVEIQLHRHFIN